MTHCIQTIWTKQTYPVDNDSVCQICLDMVKQARDQLQSNETQEELKEVFEGKCHEQISIKKNNKLKLLFHILNHFFNIGTCEFIRVKAIRKQCDKMADDFVPELIEVLSSQMNPQVVCSVAGLCNNAEIDKQIAEAVDNNQIVIEKKTSNKLTCGQCNKISTIISTKFANMDRDDVLENMFEMCGKLSSFSDGCSATVLSYFNDVYAHMKENLNSENICHIAGVCSAQFHHHEEEIEIVEDSQIGFIKHEGDDIPCDLCKQLVEHLR